MEGWVGRQKLAVCDYRASRITNGRFLQLLNYKVLMNMEEMMYLCPCGSRIYDWQLWLHRAEKETFLLTWTLCWVTGNMMVHFLEGCESLVLAGDHCSWELSETKGSELQRYFHSTVPEHIWLADCSGMLHYVDISLRKVLNVPCIQ